MFNFGEAEYSQTGGIGREYLTVQGTLIEANGQMLEKIPANNAMR